MVTPELETKRENCHATKQLKEKQVTVAVEEATVNGVSFSDEMTPTKLGPAVYSEQSVERM